MSKSASTPLARCPFCGGEAALGTCTITRDRNMEGDKGTFTGHSVNCILCGSTNRGIAEGFKTPERAAEHWNKRPAETVHGFNPGCIHNE